ncbi:hypothetical protein F2P81_019910 [Scophthalmus maximus]|uniref:Tetratricopeptide repeat protein 7 N-terminal domain-containing protein n=1 Tax=Scophthalmus maximus TaxID=52904 RepID=A0A6A4S3S9_SCOMX|nr:hypothetical protein F2P81_019910 [Scophthalmus maximus]
MASRVSFTQLRLEVELERCRAECQWDKVPAIIEQMRAARFHEDVSANCQTNGRFVVFFSVSNLVLDAVR